MTPEERAKKFAEEWLYFDSMGIERGSEFDLALRRDLTAEIRAAMREAYEDAARRLMMIDDLVGHDVILARAKEVCG